MPTKKTGLYTPEKDNINCSFLLLVYLLLYMTIKIVLINISTLYIYYGSQY